VKAATTASPGEDCSCPETGSGENKIETLVARQAETIALYTEAAHVYDRLNQILSAGTGNWYRRQALDSLQLAPEARVIDLACGTGALALAAQELLPETASILAVDPTPAMRAIARRAGVAEIREGSFTTIPAATGSCDAVVSAYALRYADPRKIAFREIRRVLRPDGDLLLLEMIVAPAGWRRELTRALLDRLLAPFVSVLCRDPAAGKLIRHLWQSISELDTPAMILSDLEEAGFGSLEYRHAGGLLGEFRARATRD
jgi:demethylmenaquinone methyltransferase/2-methoxy-6-polyprenyl-1,4-benzoquinol methylase